MSTPEEPPIVIGEIWYLKEDFGTGVGSLKAGAEAVITDYLDPYTPGVGMTDEMTVRGLNKGVYGYHDSEGYWRESATQRYLAYPESTWRYLFARKPDEEQPSAGEPPPEGTP